MPHVKSQGCQIYYDVDGPPSAPPLLLLKGLSRSSRYWGEFRGLMARRFRTIAVDNRGIGQSRDPGGGYDIGTFAQDAVAVLDELGVGAAHIFGQSMGGMIAQRIALDSPERVLRLVIGCSTAGLPGERRARPAAILAMLRAASMPPEQGARLVARWILAPSTIEERPEIVDRWARCAVEEPPPLRSLLGQTWAAFRHSPSHEVRRIACPTLVIVGSGDTLVPPTNSRLIAEAVPGARLVVLDGAGHDFATDMPEQTAAVVGGFLADEDSASRAERA